MRNYDSNEVSDMIIIASDGTTYHTATMTHHNVSSRIETDPVTLVGTTWHMVCVNFGRMFNGATSVDVAYMIYESTHEPHAGEMKQLLDDSISNGSRVFNVTDHLSDLSEIPL